MALRAISRLKQLAATRIQEDQGGVIGGVIMFTVGIICLGMFASYYIGWKQAAWGVAGVLLTCGGLRTLRRPQRKDDGTE